MKKIMNIIKAAMSMKKGGRTALVSILIIVLGLVESLDWTSIIPDQYESWAMPAIGIIMLYLRSITDTPMGEEGKKKIA